VRPRSYAAMVGLALGLGTPARAWAQAGAPPGEPVELPTLEQLALRAGAWDRSVALERTGELAQARELLLRAWGAGSPSYEVTLRIAWLSLRLTLADAAVGTYARARGLRGAGPEATEGLASSLSLRGYQSLDDHDRAAARADWQQALYFDPSQADAEHGLDLARELRFDPELWAAFVGLKAGGQSSYGGAVLLDLPLQIKDWLGVRAAYRHVEASASAAAGQSSGRGSGKGSSRTRFGQDEGYAAVGLGTWWLWIEAMGLVVDPSTEPVAGGEAARLRVGEDYGAQLEQAVVARDRGVSGQLSPTAFVWPIHELGLSAGARITLDDVGQDASALAGVSIVVEPVELHLSGHFGVERWPVSMAVPIVLTLDEELTVGGSLAGLFMVSKEWSLGVSGSIERIVPAEGQAGVYGSAGLGLRWSPRF
jgi:hypothetical protein